MTDVEITGIVIDCLDPPSLASFWQAVTGYRIEESGNDWVSLTHPAGRSPSLGLQKVPEPKVVKNRVHVDLRTADEEAAAVRIEALGARRLWVSEDPEDVFIVLADPEGNEFCVVRSA